ncbi:MAG TPA: helix-turn-helix domain-containing protein [Jatrophihabitantaceae bacterium]|nr:helix-turn-helix domain-containing protein [Jatrophihabitantaceae bacterium]
MVSQQRNTALDEPIRVAPNAIADRAILDAAYQLLLAVGMRRLNMADIARHAGVSRATLYRRWPNVQAVLAALTTREFAALTDGGFPAGRTSRAALVESVCGSVTALRAHPLLRKIIDVDPEFLLPYLLHRQGASTAAQVQLLEAALSDHDGTIRTGDPAALARTVWLTAWPFVLTAPVFVDEHVGLDVLDAQLRELLDRYLAP